VKAIQEWGGLIPSQFDALGDQDKALILAWYATTQMMAAVEVDEQEREAKRGKRRVGK
jgi:hypothetical protein